MLNFQYITWQCHQTQKNFSNQQKRIWLPFFKKSCKRNQTKQKSWGVARRLNPRGQRHGWNVMTVDGYETLDDVLRIN